MWTLQVISKKLQFATNFTTPTCTIYTQIIRVTFRELV